MNKWRLPASLKLGGVDFAIRTDYRVILGIFRVLNDDSFDDIEKWAIAIRAFYVSEDIPDVDEAMEQMLIFFNCGSKHNDDDTTKPKLMDWEQDAELLIPAINAAAGFDIRGVEQLHWWTFLSYYMSIGESTFSMVYNIRRKMAYGEKLEQYERDFVKDNPSVVILRDAERLRQDEEDRQALAEIGL